MNRPRPTVADYMVIALSPMLIMTLVGSLVFFLLGVFYQGQFESRLHFIMAMFVMAAVLIGRISIQEGREYSLLFAIPLGAATVAATFRFVEFHGPLASWSPLISVGLIGLIWWCADRLTWDCTVIDESQDVSGEGLLQTVGLDADPSSSQQNGNAPTAGDAEATTSRSGTAGTESVPAGGLWQRFVEHRRRPHAPGVWVIYFSLAALPIFGFGQWCVHATDLEGRRYVFKLLVVYVASALGLLLTTSFLGLRRYLRQRRLEMPADMAATWLALGAAMIAAILLTCMLLPRRNPEYSVTQLPIFAGSPENLRTSRWGFGNDGPNREGADRVGPAQGAATSQQSGKGSDDATGNRDAQSRNPPATPSNRDSASQPSSSGESAKDAGRTSDSAHQPNDEDPSANGDRTSGTGGKGQRDSSSPSQAQGKPTHDENQRPSDSRSKGQPGGGENQSQASGSTQSRGGRTDPGQSGSAAKDSSRQPAADAVAEKQERAGDEEPSEPAPTTNPARGPSQWNTSHIFSAFGAIVGQLLRLLYWLIAIAVVAYLLWRNWPRVVAAVQNFIRSLQELWQRIFGSRPSPAGDAAVVPVAAPPPRPFADYRDPFLTGEAERWPPDELLRYSFQAFEAWAREHGYPRSPEQTPSEFVQGVAARERQLAREALQLADLYNLFAYGKKSLSPLNVAPVRRLWQVLRDGTAA